MVDWYPSSRRHAASQPSSLTLSESSHSSMPFMPPSPHPAPQLPSNAILQSQLQLADSKQGVKSGGSGLHWMICISAIWLVLAGASPVSGVSAPHQPLKCRVIGKQQLPLQVPTAPEKLCGAPVGRRCRASNARVATRHRAVHTPQRARLIRGASHVTILIQMPCPVAARRPRPRRHARGTPPRPPARRLGPHPKLPERERREA